MDDDDYASSENEQDELMEEAEDLQAENEVEEDNEEEEEDQDEQDEPEPEPELQEGEQEADAEAEPFDDSQAPAGDSQAATGTNTTAAPTTPLTASRWRPVLRQEYIDASIYDIVPTMAAPQATSINAMAITPDLRYWLTGGSDGYIRKYNGMDTINGKQPLTVAQRHPFVDSVVKAGVLMSYWENEEPAPPNARPEDRILSPVYSLAVHSGALWLLSGLESGGINLQSVRYDEGKRIHCLRDGGHTNAVSVLRLAPDERSVLSGSWDKTVLDWDLDTGHIKRRFEGIGGQISAIELRPASGAPIPAEAGEVELKSDTLSADTQPRVNGFFTNGATDGAAGPGHASGSGAEATGDAPGSPEHESLFGSPAGSLFGDNDTMGGGGGGAFGDEDDEFSRAMDMDLHDHSGDFTMGDAEMSTAPALDVGTSAAADAPPPPQDGAALTQTDSHGDVSNSDTVTNGTIPDQPMDLSQAPTASEATQQQPVPSAPEQQTQQPSEPAPQPPASPSMVFNSAPPPPHADPTQTSASTFLSASIDGTIRIWDRRVPNPVARIHPRRGVPPWCMGACWSPDGNWLYAGRRNGTVEEFSLHKATSGWQPERALKFPAGSGAISCVRPMPNGRHLVCASHDILRLYDLRETSAFKHSKVPFIIIPGPPRAGVTADLYIDPTSRIMISIAGTRGWDGTSTEVMIGYEITVPREGGR
ncbi:7f7d4420-2484-44c9-8f89-541e154564a4 [Thermothielavioides terrestris]|uniref:SPT8-like protein n=2 Tax=Thermothielavioides terrestris TaxID=2587410 RepID=G2QZY0_THETT|nr:SPT8-like protein [Thermothielavioides terrestris NRRL 8126]AEO65551.1 SPT8-like protein [Thermothielavioides terrestris NRRL 8126]SPQ19194.1 7f7d4420-2484-44c9-8f89-541e154564a4 [Thermothielavioides terrestris]